MKSDGVFMTELILEGLPELPEGIDVKELLLGDIEEEHKRTLLPDLELLQEELDGEDTDLEEDPRKRNFIYNYVLFQFKSTY